jgi:hypothetical protein
MRPPPLGDLSLSDLNKWAEQHARQNEQFDRLRVATRDDPKAARVLEALAGRLELNERVLAPQEAKIEAEPQGSAAEDCPREVVARRSRRPIGTRTWIDSWEPISGPR